MEELTLDFTYENVTEEQKQELEKLQKDIENDKIVAAAETIEQAYEGIKKYANITLEALKAGYEAIKAKVIGLFEEVQAKRELTDEELDIVAGGGIGWKKIFKKVLVGAAVVGLAAAGLGLAGLVVGLAVGSAGLMVGSGAAIFFGANGGALAASAADSL